ncbi:hypothetical protein HanOQP8_Chr17g0657941 [Helianthus annuus]|nr:hypothetical protein HanHA89_Chr17g0703831 [Helianthus annuus]KAJ0636085.1 hypothetical protein HanOQP8_Chr17g0657941 [Helianthus annuus]
MYMNESKQYYFLVLYYVHCWIKNSDHDIFFSGMRSMGRPKRIKLMSLVLDMLIISKQDIYQECGIYYDACFNNSKSVHLCQNLQVLNLVHIYYADLVHSFFGLHVHCCF